ncbi:MAG: hypothetical protein IIX47_06250, partial [Spirochaetaceae bacterium]|nr:hypothetical protein [Spirochaetaceae bacterium]
MNKIKIKKSHVILGIVSILVLFVLAFFIHVLYVKNNGDILSNFTFSKAYEDNNGKSENNPYEIYQLAKELETKLNFENENEN